MKEYVCYIVVVLFLSGCTGAQVRELGVVNGRLRECPGTPNCVSTQTRDTYSKMEPIHYSGDLDTVREKVVKIITTSERTKIIKIESNYIHAEYRTKIMKFVNDVEFYFDDENKMIHYRAAARIGYADLGINREIMNDFIQKFEAEEKGSVSSAESIQ